MKWLPTLKKELPLAHFTDIPVDDDTLYDVLIKDEIYENQTFRHHCFKGVRFENCHFIHCHFSNCDFIDTEFISCDFSNSENDHGYYCHVLFKRTKLLGTAFNECLFQYVQFDDCLARYMSICDTQCKTVLLEQSDFQEAYFETNTFKDVSFKNLNLFKTTFFTPSLRIIDVSESIIAGLVISDTFAEIRGAKIDFMQAVDLVRFLGVVIK